MAVAPRRTIDRRRVRAPGGGDYYHAYGEPFADRFFFEIVQRQPPYDAYGAANAPARMASQAAG